MKLEDANFPWASLLLSFYCFSVIKFTTVGSTGASESSLRSPPIHALRDIFEDRAVDPS